MSLGERAYRLLLRLYPREFRARYEDELVELFLARRARRRATGDPSAPSFWAWVLHDLATSVWAERTRRIGHATGDRTPPTAGDDIMGWIDDGRYALRRLARSPGFATTAVAILALGIGVSTTAFSFVSALLLRPPPFDEPSRVLLVLQDGDDGVPNSTSYPVYLDIRRLDGVFEAVAAHNTNQVFVEQDGVLAPMLTEYATSGYLDVIGLAPSRGRWFGAVEDDPAGPPAAVLTHKLWTDRMGSDPNVVGSALRLGGRAVTVVGIGPESFHGGTGPVTVDLWLSVSAMAATGGPAASLPRRQDHPFLVRARTAPGVTVEEAQVALDRLAVELGRAYPDVEARRGITALPTTGNLGPPDLRATVVPVAAFTMAVVALVLLIATLNLANLLLVRTIARARELAMRLALGASRPRLVRVVLAEALILSALGGAAGVVLTAGALRVVTSSPLPLGGSGPLEVALDGRVLLFAVAASVGTGLLFGLLPALRMTSREVRGALTADGASVIGARRRFGLTGTLVAVQVCASLVLLSVAGVFLESLVRAQSSDPGFDWERTGFATLDVQPLDLDAEAAAGLHARLDERIAALPEVGGLTVAARLPGRMFGTTTLLLGSALDGVDTPTEIPWNYVKPDYFEVLGIPLIAGRTFRPDDLEGDPRAIVGEAMALRYWGRADVVGESFRTENAPDRRIEIVGVVGDVAVRNLGEAPRPVVYYPSSGAFGIANYLFAASGEPERALGPIRAAVAEVDRRILLIDGGSMAHHMGGTLAPQRLAGTILGATGALALVLAMLGLYGVVSYSVSRRSNEVGVRIALGARRTAVVGLFVRDVAVVVLSGGALGLALSIPSARLVGDLFAGGPGSVWAVGGAACVLLLTATAAAVVPAMRAAATDPTTALRRE